jgi:hypothetical protein
LHKKRPVKKARYLISDGLFKLRKKYYICLSKSFQLMKNVLSIIVVLSFLLALGCADFWDDRVSEIAELQIDLAECDSVSNVYKGSFVDLVKKFDLLQIENTESQAKLQNCQSTLSQNSAACNASLSNKQTEITSLTNALANKTASYNDLYELHTGLLNDNYVVYKPNVIKQLTELNALIFEGETALNHLNNIEPKDEITLQAITTTEINLAGYKGQVRAIGFFTGIQVEN